MAERSLQVVNRIRNGEAVVASGRTHRDLIAPRVAQRVEELSVDDVKKLIDGLCNTLERASDVLGAAEDRHVAELADDVPLRAERDALVDLVVARYIGARSRVEAALGIGGLKRYGLESPASRTPRMLISQTQNAVNLLRSDVTDIDDGLEPISTTKIADALAGPLARLEQVIKDLTREQREAEGTLTLRDRAIEEWSAIYQGVANLLAALYVLAGRKDLAERVRPTLRRSAGLEPPPPPEPIGDGGDPAADPAEP